MGTRTQDRHVDLAMTRDNNTTLERTGFYEAQRNKWFTLPPGSLVIRKASRKEGRTFSAQQRQAGNHKVKQFKTIHRQVLHNVHFFYAAVIL